MHKFRPAPLLSALPLAAFFLGAAPAAQAQHALWASKIIAVSSQKSAGKEAFSPEKVLGAPNALPLGQINNEAWIPKKEGPNEFIEVKFARSLLAQQVTVVENFNPGSITKVEVVDTRGTKHEVYKNDNPGPIPELYRTLEIKFPAATYRTIGVVVTMNTAKVEGVNQIDAIGIADVAQQMVMQDFKGPAGDDDAAVKFDSALVNLGPNVNTRYVDTHPVISPDGRTLFFARQDHPGNVGGGNDPQDVWYSTLQNSKAKTWGPAKNIGAPINTPDEPNGLASVTASGNSVVLTGVYSEGGILEPKGFSLSRKVKGGWSVPTKIEIEDFYNNDPDHVDCFLATSGKALLMAVERTDGLGGQDLYVSFPAPGSTKSWTRPQNLGPNVNTKKADFAPFLAADEKTLYFASEGRGGYGKSDIFYSKRLDDTWTNWSPPRNLGSVVNSPDFDAYFTLSAAGDDAYLVSSRNGTDKSKDIFRIALSPAFRPEVVTLVRGQVLDAVTKKPIKAIIRYENLLTGEEIGVTETDPVDGSYTIVLPSGVQYGYRAEAKNYIAENANLDVTARDKYSEQKQDLFLVPFAVGQTIKLNNIFFQQSKYYLRTNSYPELARLIRIMKDYPTVEIKLSGHTDNQGDPALNLKLSLDRVNEVKKYLSSKGVNGSRITTEGFGDTKPIASNDQEETRALNRRVEFTITKK
ncbi:hypothetical protein GCM10023185_03060 [Hymenobacter saemangeumensis]|uniref:OmpA-like domain-containing protein n=1 Tax=Hymenobacter saemangeumensis TaxID=1084522 RepID=A0ABP8HZ18_9BACT